MGKAFVLQNTAYYIIPGTGQTKMDGKGWNDTRADPLLPERARSECARSTAAVGPARVPFRERKGTSVLGRIIWKDEGRSMHAAKDSQATPPHSLAHASHSSRENQQPANTPARCCHRVPSDSAEAPRIVPLGLDAR